MSNARFEVKTVFGVAARVPGTDTDLIDHYEWFQLTLGRFLAPAMKRSGSGPEATEYLLLGTEDRSDSGTAQEDGQLEVESFQSALERLGKELKDFSSSEIERSGVLASLSAILQLRVPDPKKPEKGGYFLRGGLLQITGWGLEDTERTDSYALGQLLGDDEESTRNRRYLLNGIKKNVGGGSAMGRPGPGGSRSDAPSELAVAGRQAAPAQKVALPSLGKGGAPLDSQLRSAERPPLSRKQKGLGLLAVMSVMAICVALGWWIERSRNADIKPGIGWHENGNLLYGLRLVDKDFQPLLLKKVRGANIEEGDYVYYLAQEKSTELPKGQRKDVVEQVGVNGEVKGSNSPFDKEEMTKILEPHSPESTENK